MGYLIVPLAALVPMIVGFIYYHPKVAGTAWMNVTGMTEEKAQQGNMPLIFGLSFLLASMLAMAMSSFCIHQNAVTALFAMQEGFGVTGSPIQNYVDGFMKQYGELHRTFGHGAVHGVLAGLFIALPVLATNSLFEQKGWKYILINGGYWIITLALMCGVICQFF